MNRQELIEELMHRFRQVFHSIKSNMQVSPETCGLNGTELNLIMHLNHGKNGLSVKELADHIGVTSGAVTQFVDKLVEKGLVERVESKEDRRYVRISLTKKAIEHREKAKKEFMARFKTVFDDLTNDDIQQFINLLAKIKAHSKESFSQKGDDDL